MRSTRQFLSPDEAKRPPILRMSAPATGWLAFPPVAPAPRTAAGEQAVEPGRIAPAGRATPPPSLLATLLRDRWTTLRIACDVGMLVLASILAAVLTPTASAGIELAAFAPVTTALLYARGRYRRRLREDALDRIAPGVGATSLGAMTVFMLTILTVGNSLATSSLIVHAWLAATVLVTLAGALLTKAETAARSRGLVDTPTLIVGACEVGIDVARRLEHYPDCGLRVVGFVDSPDRKRPADEIVPVLGRLEDLADLAAAHGVRHVVIAFPLASETELLALVHSCHELGLTTAVVPRLSGAINDRTSFEFLGALPMLNVAATDTASLGFALKYLVDRVVAGVLLLLLAPMLLAIALVVRLSSPGPVLFGQLRTGQDGRCFRLLKFRTMRADPAGDGSGATPAFVTVPGLAPGGVEGVDRRTAIGRLLRRTSLDELPQLINVLAGSMSMIGPRPERPEFAEEFRQRFARYQDRGRVRSGITGWAQVNGSRGQTPMLDRVELDNFYIEHWSLGLDAKIVLRTFPALLKGS